MRKVSEASGNRAASSFHREVNESWMEAIDAATNRLYYVRLQVSNHGDAVRPHGDTAWEPPPGFLVRHELSAALASALAASGGGGGGGGDGGGGDEKAFLAKVRARFPPPTAPPKEMSELRNRIAELEEEKEALYARAEAAEKALAEARSAAAGSNGSVPAPPASLTQAQRPSWKRGASARFTGADLGAIAEQPPPPPPWALAKADSGAGPFDLAPAMRRGSQGVVGGRVSGSV